MTNNLPNPFQPWLHKQRVHLPIIDPLSNFPPSTPKEIVTMEMDGMTRRNITYRIPNNIIISAHKERGIISEAETIDGVELRSRTCLGTDFGNEIGELGDVE